MSSNRNIKHDGTKYICARDPTHPLDQITKKCPTCEEIAKKEYEQELIVRASELEKCKVVTCPNCNHEFVREIPSRFRDIYEDES